MKNSVLLLLFAFFVCSCNLQKNISFNYLDSYEIPSNFEFQETKVGGISGIEYRSNTGDYYLISDDRSENSPARFYAAKINLSRNAIDSINFSRSILCYDNKKRLLEKETSDFESIRYSPIKSELFVGDEGGRKGRTRIRIMDTLGNYRADFKLDSTYINKIRPNKSFESTSFSSDFKSFFYGTEAPLSDDGDEPTVNNGGLIRIIESDLAGSIKKEFLYHLEKVPFAAAKMPPWEGTGSDNGLSEILSYGKDQFLTLERSGAYQTDGTFKFTCKLFLVKGKSKGNTNDSKPVETTKLQVIDFSKLSNGNFNIEGMTLGPVINKKQSIIFISDNNFGEKIPTMVYLFTIENK
ncbi:MAG TPA: esterase-like activity of phytase family protein [Flavobacterium sp.]|nr:esterase-like activity of phytase family protein [Flavobacterium sp.]